jgi:dTDP-glucose 4,6-dehydratase
MTVLVTGGCGFIGSNFVRYFIDTYKERVVNLDAMTYAADSNHLKDFYTNPLYQFNRGNIADINLVRNIIMNAKPRAIINFAAESHVDNSIKDSSPFVETNVLGTVKFLDTVKSLLPILTEDFKFIHISTDEVYGSLESAEGSFTETTRYDPKSPYSASKAASDHFMMAYHNTFGFPAIITNCSNNYGPNQHAEKFIPTVINRANRDEKIPVYGNGMNVRDWLYVKDHCDAICRVLENGKIGEKYNIGGNNEISNIDLVKKILKLMNKSESLIEYVTDRPGHDFRYSIDNNKIVNELNWNPITDFDEGLLKTIKYYTEVKRDKENTWNHLGWGKVK